MTPKHLFTFIHDKTHIRSELNSNWQKIVKSHPTFICNIFDIADGTRFISEHYGRRFANAYSQLIPHSYKSDLFRFAYMYKYGGIYIDIKYELIDGFTFNKLTEHTYFVKEPTGIQTCLLISPPGNILFKLCIDNICKNVRDNYYGNSPCDPTGPILISNLYFNDPRVIHGNHTDIVWSLVDHLQCIMLNDILILRQLESYRYAMSQMPYSQEHYTVYWWRKQIYEIDTKPSIKQKFILTKFMGGKF